MKKQLTWVFEWRKSVHYWWSYILFSPECKELTSMLDPLSYRWGVPPVVVRCVHWTMQMWVLQIWIKAQGLAIVMGGREEKNGPLGLNPGVGVPPTTNIGLQITAFEMKECCFKTKIVTCPVGNRNNPTSDITLIPQSASRIHHMTLIWLQLSTAPPEGDSVGDIILCDS